MNRKLILLLCLFVCTLLVRAQDHRVDSIMNRVYHYKEKTGLRTGSFSSDVYLKYWVRTCRKGAWVRYLPGMFPLRRGTNDYFGESLDHYQFRSFGEFDRKNRAGYGTFPYFEKYRNHAMNRLNFSIYEPNLFSDRILSPLHYRNRHFYRFSYIYSYTSNGEVYTRIRIRPRFHNVQLVSGTMDVNNVTGAVRDFSFDLRYEFTKLNITGRAGTDSLSSLFPENISLKSSLHLLGNRVEGRCMMKADYDFTETSEDALSRDKRYDLTDMYGLRMDTVQTIRDMAYFDTLRPIPLTEEESMLLKGEKSVHEDVPNIRRKRLQRFRLSPQAENILLDSHRFLLGRQGHLKVPPLLTPSMMQWSGSRGITLQTKFAFDYDMGMGRSMDVSPRVAYNFKQNLFYWRLPVKFRLMPLHDGTFSLETGNGNRIYSNRQAEDVREKLGMVSNYDSLIHVFNTFEFHYYKDFYCLGDFSLRLLPGLRLSTGVRYHRRSLVGWNEVAQQSGMLHYIHSLAPRLHVEYTPKQYYYRNGRYKVPLYSKWPTFMIDYERGLKVGGGQSDYERWEADVKWLKDLYALRSLYFRLGAGLYTNRGDNYFLDYDYFRDNNMPDGWNDELSGQFHLLNAHWYNESDFYLRCSAAYESPMLLLSRIRWLSRIVQKERLYCSLLSVRNLASYAEVGYGFATYFLDLAVFLGIAGKQQTSAGFKFVLHW